MILDYFETIHRRKAVYITIIERMLVLIRSAVRIVLSRVYYVSRRKRNKVLNRV